MDNVKVALDAVTSEVEQVAASIANVCSRYWKDTERPHPTGHDAEWTLSVTVSALQGFQYMLKHGARPGVLDLFHAELLKYADDLDRMSAGIAGSFADVVQEQLRIDMQSTSKSATGLAEKMRRLARLQPSP